MNRDDDMKHVKDAIDLRRELAAGKKPSGVYGDSVGGRTFTDEEARLLQSRSRQVRSFGTDWHCVCTRWTIINCTENTEDELAQYEDATASDLA